MTQILCPSEDIRTIKKAHTAATTSKAPLLLNGRVVIPLYTAAANEENVFVYDASLVEVDKVAGQAWVALGLIYWDDAAKNFTTVATATTLAGIIHADAGAADTVGYIVLFPGVFA